LTRTSSKGQAFLLVVNGLDEEDDPKQHKVLIISDNIKHLVDADTSKLGIDVVKAGAFLDSLFEIAPQRTSRAIEKSLGDLKKPPCTKEEMLAALRLHGAKG
jgi:hypothetical protein